MGSNVWWAVPTVAILGLARGLVHWYINRRADKAEGRRYDEEG
ncbi:hypothetical protein [Actinopolymorpha pittospori]